MTTKKPQSFWSLFRGRGRAEVADGTPVAIPVHLQKSESMDERIRRIVQFSASQAAKQQGLETFEEADDFDVPEDPYPMPDSPWESDFDLTVAAAAERGVVAKPTPETVEKSRSLLSKAKKALSERNSNPQGGNGPRTEEGSVAPNNAQEPTA